MSANRERKAVSMRKIQLGKLLKNSAASMVREWLRRNRRWGFIAIGSIALLIGVLCYSSMNVNTVYEVIDGDQSLGLISSPTVAKKYIKELEQQADTQHPNAHMAVDDSSIRYIKKLVFHRTSNDAGVVKQLGSTLSTYAESVAVTVNGKVIGYVKDKTAADKVLQQLQAAYEDKHSKAQAVGEVKVLSVGDDKTDSSAETQLVSESTGFVQQVDESEVHIRPGQISDPSSLVKKIKTGDLAPTTYTVKTGDCISTIAHQFHIPEQTVRDDNPQIKNDLIHVGEVLDLTVYKPLISVKTIDQIKENEDIPYPKHVKKDGSMLKGEVKTLSAGKDGEKTVTLQITKVDGKVQKKQELSEQVITPPVTAQLLEGTKVISGLGTGHFIWPVTHHLITRGFGLQKAIFVKPDANGNEFHEGLDIVSSIGSRNIAAADNGKVIFTGTITGYGNCIKVDHLNGYISFYAHLARIDVKVGQIVEKGEKIGYMGETGWATGIHLHFGLYKHGKWVDPLKYLG